MSEEPRTPMHPEDDPELKAAILDVLRQHDNPPPPEPAEVWADFSRLGLVGTLASSFIGTILGAVAGGAGTYLVWQIAINALAGIFGQPQPSALASFLSVGWFAALFGLLPGAIVGLATTSTNRVTPKIVAYMIAILTGYFLEFLYGLPRTIPAVLLYISGPFAAPWLAYSLTSLVRVRLGLVPPDLAAEIEDDFANMFPDTR